MGLYKTEALVLRTRNYGEADKLLTLYTRDRGKVQAIAKGVRKPQSRLRAGVQLFTYGNFLLYQGRSLDTVTQCETLENFSPLRVDLQSFAYASYIVELLEGMMPERDGANEEAVALTLAALHLLTAAHPPEMVKKIYELRLLRLLGYQPQLDACVRCRRQPGSVIYFSSPLGGVLCDHCQGEDPRAITLTLGTVAIMQQLERMDLRKISRLRVPENRLQELSRSLEGYIEYRLEKRIKSSGFLHQLEELKR
ncbi:MAG: DNA repair protein RecO [Bacillota bacterium]